MRRLLAILALSLTAALQTAAPTESIDDFIDSEMARSRVPGLAYAAVTDGEISAVGAYGVVRAGGDEAVTPDTLFLTGSISKSFTALAVMQLVEAGIVDLDAEISRYLDGFSTAASMSVTTRQLLSHTSGFSTLQGNTSHLDRTGGDDELERTVDEIARLDPAGVAAHWEYSNANYQVLGRLIEVVSGQDYQTYIESNIMEPIGMEHSFVSDGQIHDEMATGHRPWFGTKRPLTLNRTERGIAPAGGIVSSASDLARYMLVMLNGEDDVLSAAGKSAMMRPASDTSPLYGLGWFVDTGSGTVWHSGLTPGFATLATMIPTQGMGVVVLVNANSGIGFGESTQLLDGITARALGLGYDGQSTRWAQKALFISAVLTPIVFLLSMLWAWRRRDAVRAKTDAFGRFSLWFPLLTTLGMVWFVFALVPKLFATPIETLTLFQPDFGVALIASAVTGVSWAVFRLGVAYTGKSE